MAKVATARRSVKSQWKETARGPATAICTALTLSVMMVMLATKGSQPSRLRSAAICAATWPVQTPAARSGSRPQATWEDLLERTWLAVCQVESGGQAQAVGRDGELGIAQMQTQRVDDVNRILGRRVYAYQDRLDPAKCREMFRVSCMHYWPQGGPEQWARHWNGSPTRGPSWQSTQGYWQAVDWHMQAGKGGAQ